MSAKDITPANILQIGLGFWASKTLLTAVNLQLFTYLASGAKSSEEIKAQLGLHGRGMYDFLDALVSMGFLGREGIKENAVYNNSADADVFLDKNKPSYIGGVLEMANHRLYPFWNNLEEGLKTGEPQNEVKTGSKPLFEELYSDPARLDEFLHAMGGIQHGNFMVFSHAFDFSKYKTLCDMGGAGGNLSIMVAKNNPHMHCVSFDLPAVEPIAKRNIEMMKLSNQVKTQAGDFFKEDYPKADVITMGNILHDWGTDDKKRLIKKAYNALPPGGSFVVIENIIDDNRQENTFGLLMSLNMLIETDSGYDYTLSEFKKWAEEAGFKDVQKMPLTGPSSALVAIK